MTSASSLRGARSRYLQALTRRMVQPKRLANFLTPTVAMYSESVRFWSFTIAHYPRPVDIVKRVRPQRVTRDRPQTVVFS